MTETIQLGEITIAFTRKDVKHVHLSVHPAERARDACRTQGDAQ